MAKSPMMQQYMDETDQLDDPDNLTELAAGDQIISALKQGNVALTAFNTLLDAMIAGSTYFNEFDPPIKGL